MYNKENAPNTKFDPPQSIEAEQSVLGRLLTDNLAFNDAVYLLEKSDFYTPAHRVIFKHILMVYENKQIDLDAVRCSLDNHGLLDKIGGLSYLVELAQKIPASANIITDAATIREKTMLRSVISLIQAKANSAYNPAGQTAKEILDLVEKNIFDITEFESLRHRGVVAISSFLTPAVERLLTLDSANSKEKVIGIPTGFVDLDKMTSGFHPSDLIIVAAGQDLEKMAFALNIVESVALESKLPVAIFSMGVDGMQLAMRMIGLAGNTNHQDLMGGEIEDEDWGKITNALGKLNDSPIFIDETPRLNVFDIRSRSRQLSLQKGGLGLIVIDNLQLISCVGQRQRANRVSEIAEIMRALKGLANELKIPVIILSQMNCSQDYRHGKMPLMSDLMDSDMLERNADLILIIRCKEYYSKSKLDKGKAEVCIVKNQHGTTGSIPLLFMNDSRFENMVPDS